MWKHGEYFKVILIVLRESYLRRFDCERTHLRSFHYAFLIFSDLVLIGH